MIRSGKQSFFMAAFSAIAAGALNGVELLDHMFTPRFARGADPGAPDVNRGKVRRRAHNASPERGPRYSGTNWHGAKNHAEERRAMRNGFTSAERRAAADESRRSKGL